MMRAMLLHPWRFGHDHRMTRALASNFLDGELDQDRSARVAAHAHVCPPCARFLASLRQTITGLRDLRETSEAPSVRDGVIDRLRSEGQAPDGD